jgi:GrpB-like predicted nucleotidyltransferase (UPF0157 family)
MASVNFKNWQGQYETERVRLLEALGNVTDGGIIEAIQHVGATSVSGLHGSDCVDIGMAVWPFPLETDPITRLEAMGYQVVEEYSETPQQRLRHESGTFQLILVEPGTNDWLDLILIRDYLSNNTQARDDVSIQKSKATADKPALFSQLMPDAHQWWIEQYGFSQLEVITNELENATFQWIVAGGWALDLFLANVQRVHLDVDIIVSRDSQMGMQNYLLERNWNLITPFRKRFESWPLHMRLELPRHQVHAHRGDEFIDFLLTDFDEVWHYRRDPAVIRSMEKMSLKTDNGVNYLAPELVLLFKSRNTSDHERTKDQADFEKVLPYLDPERRAWLHWALTATAPEHPWIKRLAGVQEHRYLASLQNWCMILRRTRARKIHSTQI